MNKLISIFLSGLILAQVTEVSLGDILKFNNLYQHAKLHQIMYGDSIVDFVVEHYGIDSPAEKRHEKDHNKLPFKHTGKTCTHNLVLFNFEMVPIRLGLEFPPTKTLSFFNEELYSNFLKERIFQPPRLA